MCRKKSWLLFEWAHIKLSKCFIVEEFEWSVTEKDFEWKTFSELCVKALRCSKYYWGNKLTKLFSTNKFSLAFKLEVRVILCCANLYQKVPIFLETFCKHGNCLYTHLSQATNSHCCCFVIIQHVLCTSADETRNFLRLMWRC